jgi:hypothetical protein
MFRLKKGILFIFFTIIIFFGGCDMNTRVDFILEEPEIQSENGIDFSIKWRYGIPLYYFTTRNQTTDFVIGLETNYEITNVNLKSYLIEIREMEIRYEISNMMERINVKDTYLEKITTIKKRYWGGKSIVVDSLLTKKIESEKQLRQFKNVKQIILTLIIEYEIKGENKLSTIKWQFRPMVRKSIAVWDKWMSV